MDETEMERVQELLNKEGFLNVSQDIFDDITRLLAMVCEMPMAGVAYISGDEYTHKGKLGIEDTRMPLRQTVCQFTIKQQTILEITDLRKDARTAELPAVKEGGLRYYAGIALRQARFDAVGVIYVADRKPRKLNVHQRKTLRLIAKHLSGFINTQESNKQLVQELRRMVNARLEATQKELVSKEVAFDFLYQSLLRAGNVIEYDPKGNILAVNANFCRMMGYTAKELIGQHRDLLLSEEEKNEIRKNSIRRDVLQGKSVFKQVKMIAKDGKTVYLRSTYNPIVDKDLKVVRVIVISHNITQDINTRKSLEQAKRLTEELSVQKDHFIANISHELRTPINAILGFTNLLLEGEENAKKHKQLKAVLSAGNSLLHVVSDILDLSKIESGFFQIDKKACVLQDLVNGVAAMLQHRLQEQKNELSVTIEPDVPTIIVTDENRLRQILLNLVANAIKFTKKGKITVMVRVLNESQELEFSVADTGIGIAASQLDTIFDRFTQAESDTNRKYGGSGLGLNIAKQLVDKLGGNIKVESKYRKGTTFLFTVPLETAGAEDTQPDFEKDIPSRLTPARILLCEDNPLNQNLVKALFAQTPYTLDIADNGKTGIAKLKKKHYDLILMDIQMPEMNGMQATEKIVGELQLKTPIIALTAHSLIKEKKECMARGMRDYITKPFSKTLLLNKIEEWLHATQKEPAAEAISAQKISLEQLEEFSNGDPAFKKEMLQLFVKQTTEAREKFEALIENEAWEGIAQLAHQLKTSFGIISADLSLLEKIEKKAKKATGKKKMRKELRKLEEQIADLHAQIANLKTD